MDATKSLKSCEGPYWSLKFVKVPKVPFLALIYSSVSRKLPIPVNIWFLVLCFDSDSWNQFWLSKKDEIVVT